MKKVMVALMLLLIESLLFYLYAIPTEAWAYSSVFIILIFGGWTGIDEIRKRKKCEQLKTIRKEAEVYLEMEHFGKPEDAVEREYQNLAELLGRQWENAKQEASCQISEANRYYIRWSHQIKNWIAVPWSEKSIGLNSMWRRHFSINVWRADKKIWYLTITAWK